MLAIAASILWNVGVWVMLLVVVFEPVALAEATRNAAELGAKMSWLLSPIMGYYFAAGSAPPVK